MTSITATLNKSEASHFLHTLYDDLIEEHRIKDIHPSFTSLIEENVRKPLTPDAMERGYNRGNTDKYGVIPRLRIKGNVAFFRSKLEEWFNLYYVPTLLPEGA